jgi:hypothetical protein
MEEAVEAPRGSEHSFAGSDVVGGQVPQARLASPAARSGRAVIERVLHAEDLASAAEIAGALAR